MNPRMALLFVGSVLLIVANMVGEDSDVARIAKARKQDNTAVAEQAGNADGFADDSEIGPLVAEEEIDEASQQAERLAMAEQPEIEDFSWDKAGDSASEESATKAEAQRPERDAKGLPVRDLSGLKPGEVRTDFDPRLQ